jgi:hypothetical protein
VWLRYAEPSRWASWSPQVKGVDYPYATLRAQTGGRVRGPGPVTVRFRVDAVDPARRTWSWTVQPQVAGRVVATMRLDHGVEAAVEQDPHDGTRGWRRGGRQVPSRSTTWLRLRGRAPVIAAYAPVARIALRRIVR